MKYKLKKCDFIKFLKKSEKNLSKSTKNVNLTINAPLTDVMSYLLVHNVYLKRSEKKDTAILTS